MNPPQGMNISEDLFVKSTMTGGLYDAKNSSTVAFVAFDQNSSLPSSLNLTQAWQEKGYFLFLSTPIQEARGFCQKLRNVLPSSSLSSSQILWIQNPNDPADSWKLQRLSLKNQTEQRCVLQSDVQFDFKNYDLSFNSGSQLKINTNTHQFEIIPLDGTSFRANGTLFSLGASLSIPVFNDHAGTFQFDVSLDASASSSQWDALSIELRYQVKLTLDDSLPSVTTLAYPLFSSEGVESLSVNLHPLDPINKSFLGFGSSSSALSLRSFFRTNIGQTILLTPQDGAQLVFQEFTNSADASETDSYYLVPEGNFQITFEESITSTALMCGLIGSEGITLEMTAQPCLSFFPGQAAFFDATIRGNSSLQTNALTAWIALTSHDKGRFSYFSQPQVSPFYSYSPANGHFEFAPFSNSEWEALSATPKSRLLPYAVPVVVYAGLRDTNLDAFHLLENEALIPRRKKGLEQLSQDTPAPYTAPQNLPKAISFQGALATLSSNQQTLYSLCWAKDSEGQQLLFGSNVNPYTIELSAILKNSLLSPKRCVVISESSAVEAYMPYTSFSIDGWEFDINPGNWKDFNTVLIFKSYPDVPLKTLLQNSETWNNAKSFNKDISATETLLNSIISNALNEYPENGSGDDDADLDYQPFVENILNNPDWQGVLILNAKALVTGLPESLKGLEAGIDPSKFCAHHIAITNTPFCYENGIIDQQASTFSGLIHYSNTTKNKLYATLKGDGYDFNVGMLNVLFENSKVVNFSSEVELTCFYFFSERAILQQKNSSSSTSHSQNSKSPVPSKSQLEGNIILLKGYYQSHHGEGAYVFVNHQDLHFSMESSVLEQVEVKKVQFVPSVSKKQISGGENPIAHTQFLFWGSLRFKALKDVDLFSFGLLPQNTAKDSDSSPKLVFSGMALDMSFPLETPGQKSFTFDPKKMAFDLANSSARPDSLYNNFPLILTGLTVSSGKKRPADLGYYAISTPLSVQSLDYTWYGLHFNLDLGSGGSLGGKKGIKLQMLLAWSPAQSKGNLKAMVGVKFPGAGLHIEGALKLKIKDIQLLYSKPATYELRFRRIALKILGITFPIQGQAEILIFGDPHPLKRLSVNQKKSLGWYMAYAQAGQTKESTV